MSDDDDDAVYIWMFTCPACGARQGRTIPDEGDEIDCPECDWSDVVEEIDSEL